MRTNEPDAWSPANPVEVGLLEAIRGTLHHASHPPNIDGAGCLLLDADCALRYASASSAPAETLEVAEEVCVEGPCHEAFAGEDVTYADVQSEHRWERLSMLLATSPIRTVIGVPILLDRQSIGSLNVYSAIPQAWESRDFSGLHTSANTIAGLIERALDAKLDEHGDELTVQLRAALTNRPLLREAADLLTAGTGLDRATALLRLRQMGAASDQPTIDIAAQVLEHQGMPSPSFMAARAEARRAARQEAARLAITDPLTGLANRALFLDHLEQALARAERTGHLPAVVFIDLDRFKTINDSLGHAVGDEVLRTIAARLEDEVRGQDTVARLGGDEFAVLYDAPSCPEIVEQLAQRLLVAVADPIALTGTVPATNADHRHEVSVRASFGVAVVEDPATAEAADVLRDADMAMYAAKGSGGDQLRVFSAEVRETGQRSMGLELALRTLLEGRGDPPTANGQLPDGLRMVYQPIVEIGSGRIDSLEALVRWHHRDLGDVGAAELITAAENVGLITQLGKVLLADACAAAAAWPAPPGGREVMLAVNVSPTQLRDPGFVGTVRRAIEDHGLDPSRLCLELTESQLIGYTGTTRQGLHGLHDLGVRLALDDFGTGYSSLSSLAELPVTRLKLDRSFVVNLTPGSRGDALARSVVALGRSLELQTVAEGIETSEQAAYLAALDCDLAQGFLYSCAIEADEVPELLRAAPLLAPELTTT